MCTYTYIYLHTCSAIPMPEKDGTEFGDDKNDIMALNTSVRVYKQTYMGTHVTTLSANGTVLPLTFTYVNARSPFILILLISGEDLHRDKCWHKSIHMYGNPCKCYKFLC